MSGEAASAGNTLCIFKDDNEAWRNSDREKRAVLLDNSIAAGRGKPLPYGEIPLFSDLFTF